MAVGNGVVGVGDGGGVKLEVGVAVEVAAGVVGVGVADLVGVADGDGIDVGVAVGQGVTGMGGTYSGCPTTMAVLFRQLARRSVSTSTLKRRARE